MNNMSDESSRRTTTNTMSAATQPLHTAEPLRRRILLNRVFSGIYTCAILTLLYHQALKLVFFFFSATRSSKTTTTFFLSLLIFIANLTLAFQWIANQSFRMRPIRRTERVPPAGSLEQLEEETSSRSNSGSSTAARKPPKVDVFVCTADPFKEPPVGVVNTALSVMAYDYPKEKLSIYVSDDGGSQLTLFAFMEAARFARHWLPFCDKNNITERCPDAFFAAGRNSTSTAETEKIKTMYESMKVRVENAVERGRVGDEYILKEKEREALSKWTHNFTRKNHPAIIEALLVSGKDKDVDGGHMPNLLYVSREKSQGFHHHFKAGALNTLVRVSATITNAPIVLTLDCDTFSNDPGTIRRALCYFSDPTVLPNLGYVQFPQIFRLSKEDVYGSEYKRLFQINPVGMDGFRGPNYVGSNCFFNRRALFGGPRSKLPIEIPELSPDHRVERPVESPEVMALAHQVAACNYEEEQKTLWGSKVGFRYGSLVEDFFTGYRMQCEGWISIFCNPESPAFLGDSPRTLLDLLGQCKRWSIGLAQVLFSKYCPLTYGTKHMGFIMGLAYSHYACWPVWCVPITIYAFIPQLALLNGVSIFPEVGEGLFFLHIFLFVGAYGQDLSDFMVADGTLKRWWNTQRIWMITGLSSFPFALVEFSLMSLGVSVQGFNLTSKVQGDGSISKRYEQGTFEFGAASPMFVPITMAALMNLIALAVGSARVFVGESNSSSEGLMLQILVCGFVGINSWPLYEAMAWRTDDGRMPGKVVVVSLLFVLVLCVMSYVAL